MHTRHQSSATAMPCFTSAMPDVSPVHPCPTRRHIESTSGARCAAHSPCRQRLLHPQRGSSPHRRPHPHGRAGPPASCAPRHPTPDRCTPQTLTQKSGLKETTAWDPGIGKSITLSTLHFIMGSSPLQTEKDLSVCQTGGLLGIHCTYRRAMKALLGCSQLPAQLAAEVSTSWPDTAHYTTTACICSKPGDTYNYTITLRVESLLADTSRRESDDHASWYTGPT